MVQFQFIAGMNPLKRSEFKLITAICFYVFFQYLLPDTMIQFSSLFLRNISDFINR